MSTASVPATSAEVPAPVAGRQLTIREQLRNPVMLQQIAMVVPQHMKPERMVRIALTALTRTPDLANCDQASFFRCLMDLSQWGLEPDGRHAHLIPRENRKRGCLECTMIIDYKGYVQLAYRSGFVKNIHADVVRKGDIFDYNRGQVVKHVPWYLRTDTSKPDQAGEIIATYCFVELKDGAEKSEALSREEVEGIRKRSAAGNRGPWVSDWSEMAKKTAFRRVSKWIPLSAEIVEVMERDDDRVEDFHNADRVVAAKDLDALTDRLMPPRRDQDEINAQDASTVDQTAPADDGNQDLGDPQGESPEERAERERYEQEAAASGRTGKGKQKTAFDSAPNVGK